PSTSTAILLSLLNPNNDLQLNGQPFEGPNWTETVVVTAAVYMIDTIKIDEHWQILGGLRLDSYGIERRANNARDIESDCNFVNWHAGIVYKPVDAGTIYAAIGTSSNPAGEQLDATSDQYGGLTANSSITDPERTKSYEIGVKWKLFNEHLLATAAGFPPQEDKVRVPLPRRHTAG